MTHLNNPDVAYDAWTLWKADEKRHTPSELMQEPSALLDDVLAIENYYNALKAQKDGD